MTEIEARDLLIGKWFPITEVSVESVRERSASSALPPLYFLHIWFARRPLATSRSAVLGSLFPADITRESFLELMGIPANVNLRRAQEKLAQAKSSGIHLDENPYFWARAFEHVPTDAEIKKFHDVLKNLWGSEPPLVVDPMAGGGSIPFETMRLGLPVVAGDLNPVAFVCLKGTLEFPASLGEEVFPAVESFCKEMHEAAKAELGKFFPRQPGEEAYAYLWARTIKCYSCGLTIPLSPTWWIVKSDNEKEKIAVKIIVPEKGEKCVFEIVRSVATRGLDPDKGTVKGGRAECPRCHTVIASEEVKQEAQKGLMGRQVYCVYVKRRSIPTKVAKHNFRTPTLEEEEAVQEAESMLAQKLPGWETKNLVPIENFPKTANDTRPIQYGMPRWCDLFNPRQLLCHLTYLEKFLLAKEDLLRKGQLDISKRHFTEAVLTYASMVFDTCVNYNSVLSRWQGGRGVRGTMDIQAFPFRWSYAEWNQLVPGGGYEWALSKVLGSMREITHLLPHKVVKPRVYCGTATRIPQPDKSVPCIVVDPPYAENVMYAEISDFFYVWLKRLLGDVYPEVFKLVLTEKEEEAVANPARFKGMGRSAKKLALEDYKTKMEACFREMHRVLWDDGVMTVMFTHRTAEAWSSLATALMNADFTFISSWPVHTEMPDKYAKRGKGVLKITVLLTCRKRKANHPGIWEHIAEELRDVAKRRIEEFSKLGIDGPDLKVSVYGPVLGKFADYFPVKTATGKEMEPQQALDLVADVLNEKFLQEAGIQEADKETAAYINLLATFPNTETEYEEARLATVFGGLVTLDTLDVKGTYGLIEKKGKSVKILSARDRQGMGVINPYDPKSLKTSIDHVHAAILQYERGGLVEVKRFMQERNLDLAGSPFQTVLQAYSRYAGNSSIDVFQKDAAVGKALLAALGRSIEFAPKKGERLDHYTSES